MIAVTCDWSAVIFTGISRKVYRFRRKYFRPQINGDLVKDGVCAVLIAEKLGVSQPTASEHLKILQRAGLLRGKRMKQWTFYQRDEMRINKLRK